MNPTRANHFGNPLITAKVGIKSSIDLHSKAPASPGSTFSKNDLLNSKIAIKQSNEDLLMGSRERISSSSSAAYQHHAVSPNVSFTERDPLSISSQGESSFSPYLYVPNEASTLLGSTITTASTIGLPSHYPGSTRHNRITSLESSVLLEELLDFDDIFGQGQQAPSSNNLLMQHNDNDNESESFISRNQTDYNDDDDDLHALSRSLPFHSNLQHRRNVSEWSTSSLSMPPSMSLAPPVGVSTEKSRSTESPSFICSNNSNHTSSSARSVSTIRSHRRSRNRAMGSIDFQNSVLDDM